MTESNIPGLADISFDEEEAILTVKLQHKSDVTLEEAKLMVEKASKLSKDIYHVNLVDIRNMTFMSNSARKFFAEQNKKTLLAIAVISNTSFHQPLLNLYLKFTRPQIPTRFFDHEEDARKWLHDILNAFRSKNSEKAS